MFSPKEPNEELGGKRGERGEGGGEGGHAALRQIDWIVIEIDRLVVSTRSLIPEVLIAFTLLLAVQNILYLDLM